MADSPAPLSGPQACTLPVKTVLGAAPPEKGGPNLRVCGAESAVKSPLGLVLRQAPSCLGRSALARGLHPGCTPAGTAACGRALSLLGVDPRSIPRVSPHPRPAPSVATPILLHPIPRGPPPLTPKFAPSHTHGPSVPAGPQPTPLLPQGPASLPPGSLVSAPERRPGLPLPPPCPPGPSLDDPSPTPPPGGHPGPPPSCCRSPATPLTRALPSA